MNITKCLSMKKNTSHGAKVNELSEILNEKHFIIDLITHLDAE